MNDTINPQRTCSGCNQPYPLTHDYFARTKYARDGFETRCHKCNKNRTDKLGRVKRWQRKFPEKVREYSRRNKKRLAEYHREYNAKNPSRRRVNYHNRRARQHSLPDTFTYIQWNACLEYWHGCCAVCGNQLRDLFGDVIPHADHWIPITYQGAGNPGTVPTNMICLCNSCNCSKNDSVPEQWLVKRFGKRKANVIIQRIEAYFEWVKQQG